MCSAVDPLVSELRTCALKFCRNWIQYLLLPIKDHVTLVKLVKILFNTHFRLSYFPLCFWHSPLPQDMILHRCQLGGRGFQAQWNSRAGLPLRRCEQVTWRDWNPWRPQVAVHWVQGLARHCRAHASVVQLRCKAGLKRTNMIRPKIHNMSRGLRLTCYIWILLQSCCNLPLTRVVCLTLVDCCTFDVPLLCHSCLGRMHVCIEGLDVIQRSDLGTKNTNYVTITLKIQ